MAPTVASSGTQTATIATEHVLLTQSTAKTCVLSVNLSNLVLGDSVTLNIYNKVLTGDTLTPGTTLPEFSATYTHARSEGPVQSPAIVVAYQAKFTLTQTAGTGRAFDWNVCTLD